MNTAPATELDSIFLHELQAGNQEVRRQAALAAFRKLRPDNEVTVEQFLTGMQQHQEVWAAVSSLGIVEFAEALAGAPTATAAQPSQRRTRITDELKTSLKGAILQALPSQPAGMSRTALTAALLAAGLAPSGIATAALADKVRQPLRELVAEGKLHTVGEKRLMKYMMGPRT